MPKAKNAKASLRLIGGANKAVKGNKVLSQRTMKFGTFILSAKQERWLRQTVLIGTSVLLFLLPASRFPTHSANDNAPPELVIQSGHNSRVN